MVSKIPWLVVKKEPGSKPGPKPKPKLKPESKLVEVKKALKPVPLGFVELVKQVLLKNQFKHFVETDNRGNTFIRVPYEGNMAPYHAVANTVGKRFVSHHEALASFLRTCKLPKTHLFKVIERENPSKQPVVRRPNPQGVLTEFKQLPVEQIEAYIVIKKR